jgi:ATP synthase F1 delta subunit
VADELGAFAALATDAPNEWEALTSPNVPNPARKATIDKLLADASPLTRNVLKLIVDNGRLEDLDLTVAEFRRLVREQEGQLDVHVTSAVELSADLRTKLEARLSSSTGRQVQLHTSVDPDIIGGLVVRHGDTLVDTSLRGRLDSLRLQLSRGRNNPSASTDSSHAG